METVSQGSGRIDTANVESTSLEKKPIFWFYGSSSMAYGIKDNAFSYVLFIFANQALGVPGYLASIALAIAVIWDAISDPLLGHWSDKTRSRVGRRHPFMYASLFIFPAGFYALFNPIAGVRGEDAFVYILFWPCWFAQERLSSRCRVRRYYQNLKKIMTGVTNG